MIAFDARPAFLCSCGTPQLASSRPKHVMNAFSFPVLQASVFQASAVDAAPQQGDKLEAEEEQVPRRPTTRQKHPEISRTQWAPTLDPRIRIKAYRKEAFLQKRAAELEEEAKKIDLDPAKLLKQGDPSSVQAAVKAIIPVGLFLAMPNGKEGFLPSADFGFSGGVVILQRLFKVGQVLTVKVVRSGGGGREIVSMRKELPVEV